MSDDILQVLQERGLLYQASETGLTEAARERQLLVYCGFDPTAPSLHVGHLMGVMLLANFQRCGHRPIILVGGGTGLIGDPSFKASERPLISLETAAANAERIRKQLEGFLSFEGPNGAIVANNADWLVPVKLIEFLRDTGKHFSINAMIAKESVRARLEDREQGISFTEFTYMLLQAYDYLQLYDRHACTVQVGGSDQWGNIVAGVDLIRRARGAQAHAVTGPLLTTSSGQKMGKSEGNALWLDPSMTPPYDMFQYWINVDDRDVERWLKVFTFLPLSEIAALAAEQAQDPGSRVMQRRLAREIVTFVHGASTAAAVERAAAILFGGDPRNIDQQALGHVLSAMPHAGAGRDELTAGVPVLQAVVRAGLAASNSAARTLVSQGGLYVNNQRWDDPKGVLTTAQLLCGRAIVLRSGRKSYGALVVE